ncbi:hypothetical protein COY05_01470 [Candidatus Peregrinibacteria bacterium CG_4_10_14_0_2_um_filter_38_24]|nr:MAG: hypothetical protein COY05_01470 [Candidatus Peregrinibacteria bacterium CG_4_10_14_0_2_um_filter_38_24]PJB11115.1 MAG: hypothetical protein CO120_01320 [Gammaproteobacteria bacterium CG_4_9_14_3_um_filter_38_9]
MSINSSETERTPQQIAAIQAAKRLAKQLIEEKPEIADDYRSGLNQGEIVKKYSIDEVAQTTRVARTAVCEALKELIDEEERAKLAKTVARRNGEECFAQGKGVHGMDAEKRRVISSRAAQLLVRDKLGMFAWSKKQQRAHGESLREREIGIHALSIEQRRQIGRTLYEKKLGIFAQTTEELSANGRKARDMGVGVHAMTFKERSELARRNMADRKGVTALSTEELREIGKRVHEERKGIHALTHEEHVAHGKKSHAIGAGIHSLSPEEKKIASQKAAISRGQVPWENHTFDPETGLDEHHYCLRLLADPKFQIQRDNKTLTRLTAIAQELNRVFHEGRQVRTKKGISMFKIQRANRE